jgi:sugar O-acyltransferase (sialic acid O-acetyltransferase NeuD family)
MKDLILVGAGAFGLEVFSWIESAVGFNKQFKLKGFLDSKTKSFGDSHFCDVQILGTSIEYEIKPNDVFVCTIGNPSVKKMVVEELHNRGAKFINLVHNSIIEFNNITYGNGIIISPYCVISNNVILHNHVSINLFCSIGHDAVIGRYSVLSSHCDITGGVVLGEEILAGSGVKLIPRVSVIDGTVLGAGAIIMRSIKKAGTYVGNPAMRLL